MQFTICHLHNPSKNSYQFYLALALVQSVSTAAPSSQQQHLRGASTCGKTAGGHHTGPAHRGQTGSAGTTTGWRMESAGQHLRAVATAGGRDLMANACE